MKKLERFIIDELLDAPKGLYLSIYIPAGTTDERCDLLKEAIVEASGYLQKILGSNEIKHFLEPLTGLTKDDIEKFELGIGFFRSSYDFRVIGIPDVKQKECIVSDHYNIKPLLHWAQNDIEFFCVEILNGNVEVFHGNSTSFAAAGCFGLRLSDPRGIDNCILEHSESGRYTQVYLSGNDAEAKEFLSKTTLSRVDKSVVDRSLYQGDYEILYEALLDRVRHMAILRVKRSLLDFNKALMDGHASNDLTEIIQAAKEGNVSKLIVSSDQKVWGRFDAYKNQLNRINKQINYEDDDLLDAISECVLENGGEVVVAEDKQLPRGKTALAILKEQSKAA